MSEQQARHARRRGVNRARAAVLSEAAFQADSGAALWAKRVALVILGVAVLAIAAKVKVPMWPVPVTMQTFFVLSIGAAYGFWLGSVTLLAYLALGALGMDVFTNSSATENGLAYMMGGTGGYLLGYLMASAALGALARRGWDRSVGMMALAMLIGTALIYIPGVLWLGQLYGWDQPILEWGLYPFLLADAAKLALAALLFPMLWRAVGDARA